MTALFRLVVLRKITLSAWAKEFIRHKQNGFLQTLAGNMSDRFADLSLGFNNEREVTFTAGSR